MATERIIDRWSCGTLNCCTWTDQDTGVINGGVSRAGEAIATIQVPRDAGETAARTAVDAIALTFQRPAGVFDVTYEPVTDLVMVPMPGQLRGEQPERIDRAIDLATDLSVIPVSTELRDMIYRACDPQGIGQAGLRIDLRGRPLYAFVRANMRHGSEWDEGERLQLCIALSRLVRPTSAALGYAVRLIGRFPSDCYQIKPGPVRGSGARAWTPEPDRDWLSAADFAELRQLNAAWDVSPFERRSRSSAALWYFEYASRTELVDIRVQFITTAIETLIGTSGDRSTQQFKQRVPQLGASVGLDVSNAEAGRMWSLRSKLVHGERHGGLSEQDLGCARLMEDLLRRVLRQAVADGKYRAQFADKDAVDAAFPLAAVSSRSVTCPSCSHVFVPSPNPPSARGGDGSKENTGT
jgi:hypothetical protein